MRPVNSPKQDMSNTIAHAEFDKKNPSMKYSSFWTETKCLQTIKRTDVHTSGQRENMISYEYVVGYKKWFRSVPQNTNSQGWLVFCGTERNKKKKKKKEGRISWKVGDVLNNLWLFTYEHSVCMRASCKHPSNIRQWILKLMYRNQELTDCQTDGRTQWRSSGKHDITH